VKISFPRLGNYDVPFRYFIRRVFDAEVITPPVITKKTMELGSLHSPDFVCSPFKFNLGNHLEALELGADTILQFGGICRLGYYGELHEQILRDLGYDFTFINLGGMRMRNPKSVWDTFKKYNENLSLETLATTLPTTYTMVRQMDELEKHIRKNIGFETKRGSYDKLYKGYLTEAEQVKSKKELKRVYAHYLKEIKNTEVNLPKNLLKVGVIGEYYTVMEPFANHFLEKELAKMQMYVTRNLNVSSTVFHNNVPKILKKVQHYVKYDIGATGVDTINSALSFARKNYDGLIHVKSFGCMPEIDAMPILQNISEDLKIPILYLTFDTQTSETGIKTRLEAFQDMIIMRKGKQGL
jgi:predicted nucleotide-binding protein (sugar kinase/HSP70/actin superfamily)